MPCKVERQQPQLGGMDSINLFIKKLLIKLLRSFIQGKLFFKGRLDTKRKSGKRVIS